MAESSSAFNFPDGLNISPSSNEGHTQTFLAAAHARQTAAIDRYGIAGAGFGANSVFQREASYLLTRYICGDAHGPGFEDPESHVRVEYDPPCPFKQVNVVGFCEGRANRPSVEHTLEGGPWSENIIELGSGMGIVGFAAAESLRRAQIRSSSHQPAVDAAINANVPNHAIPARVDPLGGGKVVYTNVVLTDLPDVCTLLRENAYMQLEEWKRAGLYGLKLVDEEKFQHSEEITVDLRVRPLPWGNIEHVRTLSTELHSLQSSEKDKNSRLTILCSDLVYFPHLLAPLLRTLIHLTSSEFLSDASAHATIIMSYRLRSFAKETPFWRAFGTWFSFQPVLERQISTTDSEWRRVGWTESALSFVFIAQRRPETLTWHCPERDDELLNKLAGDDTFEILLMLCNEAAED